jgi:small redox-active disulfide protein 2
MTLDPLAQTTVEPAGLGRERQMTSTVRVIEVLGSGCARCFETLRVVRHVVDEAHLECLVVKDESVERMAALGVLRTPAVAFDGRVVVSGRIPKAQEVRQLLGLA